MSDLFASIILYNARVLTLNPAQPRAEAVAVKGNKILAVGSKHEVEKFKGANSRLFDCEGKVIVPGFNDAHCHPISFAITQAYLDCSSLYVKNIEQLKKRIHNQAVRTPKSKWIRAAQYNEYDLAEKRHPTRLDLDKAAPENPTILVHASGSICVLNSLALKFVGLSTDTVNPENGQIGRDDNGKLNGIITGRNKHVENKIPPLDQEEIYESIRIANQYYLSHGITSLQDTTWSNSLHNWNFYKKIKKSDILLPRITMMVGSNVVDEFNKNGLHTGIGDNQLCIGAAKIALDESSGNPRPPEKQINDHAIRAHKAGFQLAFHVSDIYNLQKALASLELIKQIDPKPLKRPRFEHCAICPTGLMHKMKSFQPIVVTQPSFLYYMGKRYLNNMMPDQLKWLYNIKSLCNQGVMTALSSDSPVVPCNPIIGIYAAVTRKEQSGRTIMQQESVSPMNAIKMYTLWPAYASFTENLKGSITKGKLADMTLLSDDPADHQIKPEKIMDIKAVLTIIDGKIVWEG